LSLHTLVGIDQCIEDPFGGRADRDFLDDRIARNDRWTSGPTPPQTDEGVIRPLTFSKKRYG
jgi:hypothetical protein